MNLKVWIACCISISFSLLGDLMTPRTLRDALEGMTWPSPEEGKPKIVYIGVGSASKTDTYQAYPLFMQLLAAQYPGLCRTINFDVEWKNKAFSEELILKRDPTLNKQNFFIIDTNFDLRSTYQTSPACSIFDALQYSLFLVLDEGGCVILGKFGNCADHLELTLLYTWLSRNKYVHKSRILFFSTHDGLTSYWWQGAPYSLYNDLITTERLTERLKGNFNWIDYEKKKLTDKASKINQILTDKDKAIWSMPEKTEDVMTDILHKHITYPKTALLENASSLVIDVVKVETEYATVFNIQDVYFLNATLENLHRSLQLIALVANSS